MEANIKKEFPDAVIIDVTSKAKDEFVRLSPFYPVGGIPVPGKEGMTSESVEGVWQGLKMFEGEGTDASCFRNKTMKGLKRTCRTHGKCLGHSYEGKALGYIEARKTIYIPSYKWMLENKCADLVKKLKIMSQTRTVVLLDYDTYEDIENTSKPLSHASLIKKCIIGELK
ncbi:MAG: hypothetical protein J6R79_01200 [Bacteroidaceae bacterium]|nr:hypothetical protein [Bacteroidaceae bacterium]